jgi:hypothetical protein
MAVALPHPLLGRHRHPRLRHPRPAARAFRACRVLPDGPRDPAGFRQSQWGEEDKQTLRELPRLNAEEGALYDDLRDNRLRRNLRLEQERIGFGWVEAALAGLVGQARGAE